MHIEEMNGLREEWFRGSYEQVYPPKTRVRWIETPRRRARSHHEYMQALNENMVGGKLSLRRDYQVASTPVPSVTTTVRYQNEILGGNVILVPNRHGSFPISMLPLADDVHNAKFIVVSPGRDFTSDDTDDRATITRLVERNTPESVANMMMYPMTSLEMIEKNLKVFAFVEELRSLWTL